MQRLRSAEDRGQGLHGHPGQVDLGLLGGELHAGGLGVEAQRQRLRVLRTELLAHDLGPDPARGAELRHLLEQRRTRDEEERQPRGEVIDVLAGRDGGTDVLDAVGQGERHLLRGRRARLGHVVAGDGDGVPARDLGLAVAEDVGDQPQGLRRRVDVGAARDVLLEHVVLDRAGQHPRVDAVLLRDELVEQQQQRRGGVDGHRGRDLVERDPAEEDPHVLDRVDRDPDLADLPGGDRVVGVIPHLGGQVEGDAQPAGAGRDELVVALVGLLGRAEAGVLAHRPRPAGVHGRVDPAGVGVLPRLAELALGVPAGEGLRAVDRLDRHPGLRRPGFAFTTSDDHAAPSAPPVPLQGRYAGG